MPEEQIDIEVDEGEDPKDPLGILTKSKKNGKVADPLGILETSKKKVGSPFSAQSFADFGKQFGGTSSPSQLQLPKEKSQDEKQTPIFINSDGVKVRMGNDGIQLVLGMPTEEEKRTLPKEPNPNDLPSTSNLKIQATDARVSGYDTNAPKIASAKSLGKAALLGLSSVASGTLEGIGIAAKKLDFFNEYKDKTAEELATYKAGQWIDEQVKDLVGDLSPEEQANFSVKLAQGVGQVGGFFIGGAGSRMLKMSEGLTVASLGAATQGSSEYKNAINAGATPDEASKVFWINAALGTTQALPIMGAFRKLDKYTGGLATGVLAQKIASSVEGRITSDILQGAITQSVQQAVQTTLTNVVAKNTYDTTRDIFEGVLESAATGAIIGATMIGALSAIRERRAAGNLTPEEDADLAKAQKFAEEKIKENKVEENIINHATKVKENVSHLPEKQQDEFVKQSVREKVATEKAEKLTDPTLIKQQKAEAKEAHEIKEQLLQGKDPDEIVTESQQKKIDEEEKRKTDLQRLQEDFELENKKFDEQRKGLDGRIPEDRPKIEQLELKRKRAKEDFEKDQAKLLPKEEAKPDPISEAVKAADTDIKDEIYRNAFKENPEQSLKELAQQLNGNADESAATRRMFGDRISDIALQLHPQEKVESKPKIRVSAEQVEERQPEKIKQRYIDDFNVVEDSKFDWRVKSELSSADRKKAAADIKAGKETAATRKLNKEMDDMLERGTVIINRGRGSQAETVEMPVEEWFKFTPIEHDKAMKAAENAPEEVISIIQNEGITLQNIDNLKDLFNGFPYDQTDFNNVKAHLQGETTRNAEATRVSKQGQAEKINETTPAEDNKSNQQSELIPEKESKPSESIIEPPQETAAGEKPPEPPEAKIVAGKGDGNKVGVSHSKLTELSEKMGLKEPERGEYLSPQWYADRGRKLLEEGANPNEVDNPNNTLHDRISIARAHLENLVKASDEIAKHNPEGVNSEEYKKASQEVSVYAEKVKGLGTEAHRAMTSLQGERDIDTDSFTAVKRTLEDDLGKPASKEQEKKIQELTNQNQKLKEQTQELEKKLIEATDKAVKESSEKQTPKEKAKSIADKIRQAKIHRPGMFSAATPASIVWDASVEVVAKTVEAGGKIIDAIEKGIKYMQATDWYKKLNDADKKEAEKQFKDWHEDNGIDTKEKEFEEKVKSGKVRSKSEKPLTDAEKILEDEAELKDLQQKFVNKQGNKFSIDEAKDIWEYGKKNYTDKGVSYRDMLINVSNDLGLSWKQVSEALTSKKVKPISDSMWKKSADYRKSQIATKNWVEAQNKSLPFKALRKVSAAFRGVAVFGHGGIFIGTHAGMTLFNPSQWHVVIPAFIRGWKFAYGNRANYERRIEQLRNNKNYVLAQRAGLKNNPDVVNTEEFQKSQEFFKKIGGEAGVKGFNAIKVLRQDLFDYHYNRLSDIEKNDAESVKQIARLVNNATGASNLKFPEWVKEVSFAGEMESARWGKLTRNPARATAIAIKALITPEKATVAERVFAKVWARRVGEQLATMTAMLAANAAIQSMVNPKNPTNLTNPNKPDYLKFKFGDITIDPTSGMMGTAKFIYGIGKVPFMNKKELRGDTRIQYLGKSAAGYARGKAAPLYSTMADFFAQQDFNKNPLPFSEDKPGVGHHKLTWGEYAWEKAPLPLAHAAQDMYHSALDNGADKVTLNHVLDGIIAGGISGGTGFRVGEYNAQESNHSPFTEADKKDSTFKYFLDKGMELPNTALTSEEVKDEKTHTIKKVSDYPKDIQEKYSQAHKEALKESLKNIIEQQIVFVNPYGEVSINEPADGEATEKNIDKLSKEELAQVLHIAQSQATQNAKDKIFYHKKD